MRLQAPRSTLPACPLATPRFWPRWPLVWGGSYLLIKYALDGFSAAMIVSARGLIASAVLFVVLQLARPGAARRCVTCASGRSGR